MKATPKDISVTKVEKGVSLELTREEARRLCDIMKRNIVVPTVLKLSANEYDIVQTLMGDIYATVDSVLGEIKRS